MSLLWKRHYPEYTLISWTTTGGGHTQLDLLTFANVTNNYYKLFAHAGCAIIFFSFILYMITRESIFYINLRQAYLLSPYYASRISSRTVLFTSVRKFPMNAVSMTWKTC